MNKFHRPSLWIFAGVNGAGKSSLVKRYGAENKIVIVNPDNIAAAIDIKNRDKAEIQAQAGRIAISTRNNLLEARETFGIETTLSGKNEIRFIIKAKNYGYKINLIYVGLSNVAQSAGRVKARIIKGGHSVSEQDIIRRFPRSLENLIEAIKLSDRIRLFDNSEKRRKIIAKVDDDKILIFSSIPEWAEKAIIVIKNMYNNQKIIKNELIKAQNLLSQTNPKLQIRAELPQGVFRFTGKILLITQNYVFQQNSEITCQCHEKLRLTTIPNVGENVKISYSTLTPKAKVEVVDSRKLKL